MPLNFFTNQGGGGYGTAVPFQRIVEPSQLGMFLNLEQAELLRIQRYNEGWRFYFGKHWLFKREDGEPLVTLNYFRKFIDKTVEFLVAKGFINRVPDPLEYVTKPFLDEVWEYNKRDQIGWDAATMGGVTGDVFFLITYERPSLWQMQINPYSQGRIRVNLLGSEQVFPTWDPLNTDTLLSVRIETIYFADRGLTDVSSGDPAGRDLQTKRFTQIITRDTIVEQFHGEMPVVKSNPLGEIPLVHIKNISLPKEYYGLPDGLDIIDPQRELNEKLTDVSDTINYHSAPITIIYGAKAKTLQRGPHAVWAGLPENAKVETLKLEGDLTAAKSHIDFIKKSMHELSDVPEGALGSMQPISNTSGVALHIQYQPIIGRTKRKRAQYEPGFEQINYFILRTGAQVGLLNVPFDICKSCGGRIQEIPDVDPRTGEQRLVRRWDPSIGAFAKIPAMKKRCFHMDKQTLEFTDPYEMRIKMWRQYGFGAELREMEYGQILSEIAQQKRSFWDYTVLQEAMLDKWRADNTGVIQDAHDQHSDNVSAGNENNTPPQLPGGAEPATAGDQHQPVPGPTPQALVPQVMAPPPQIKPPPMLQTMPMPIGEIDVPEEPVQIIIRKEYRHPETGEVLEFEDVPMFLVPTDCQQPAYLNPFASKVEFPDVLPKDEAIQSQLYAGYQTNGWVDEQWAQDNIPEIAKDAVELRRRMKKRQAIEDRLQPQMIQSTQAGETVVRQNELSPIDNTPAQVPGPGGNPVSAGQQPPKG